MILQEHGLVLVGGEEEEVRDEDEDEEDLKPKSPDTERRKRIAKMALVSQTAADILKHAGSGNLGNFLMYVFCNIVMYYFTFRKVASGI